MLLVVGVSAGTRRSTTAGLVPGSDRLGALVDPLVESLAHEAPLAPWLQVFMGQVTDVHGRLRTLHYKNLGQLLALGERIAELEPKPKPKPDQST